jgi:hypothetical protein
LVKRKSLGLGEVFVVVKAIEAIGERSGHF